MKKFFIFSLFAAFSSLCSVHAQENTYSMVIKMADGTVFNIGPNDVESITFNNGQLTVSGIDIDALTTAIQTHGATLQAEAARIATVEATLETRINAVEADVTALKSILSDKLDQETFNTKLQDVYSIINNVEASLAATRMQLNAVAQELVSEETARKASVADIQQQVNGLNAYTSRVKSLDESVNNVEIAVGTMNSQIASLTQYLVSTQTEVETLKARIADLQNQIDTLSK